MTPLTRRELQVLELIPGSTATGGHNATTLKWRIQSKLDMSPMTLNVYWDNFKEAGLIETTGGFVKRTASGDRACDPVGAVGHEQLVRSRG